MPFDGVSQVIRNSDIEMLLFARNGIAKAWIQEAESDNQGGRCAIGWVKEAVAREVFNGQTMERLIDQYLYPALPKSMRKAAQTSLDRQLAVERFNDVRTQRRVARLFDDAIILARSGPDRDQ